MGDFDITIDTFITRWQKAAAYQHVFTTVKPERDQNNRDSYRKNWWIFGGPRGNFRPALANLPRYIATVETSKHRFFTFLDKTILPDNMLVNIAHDDAWILGVLSSTVHVRWALAKGGTLEDRPRYNKSVCFETFPFPAATEAQKTRIRELAEQLNTHRKRQQAAHPELTITGIYNVLDKLRTAQPLTAKDKKIHDNGLVSLLKQLHDDLDVAVFEAHGWPHPGHANLPIGASASSPALLANREIGVPGNLADRLAAGDTAAEEANGQIRWIRPEYQVPGSQKATAAAKAMEAGEGRSEAGEAVEGAARDDRDEKRDLRDLRDFRDNGTAGACATLTPASSPSLESLESLKSLPASLESLNLPADSAPATTALYPWPDELPAQFAIIRRLLADTAHSAADSATVISAISAKLAGSNRKKRRAQLQSILETLQALGHA